MKKIVLLAFALLSLCVASLLELQIVYASSYKDIDVITAHNMITNGTYPDLVVLDVRTKSEYDDGHICGAVWIPDTELETRIDELAGHENHEIIVYCLYGGRSATASVILDSHNFTKVYNMLGGIWAWQSAGYPVLIATVHNVNTTFNYDTIQAAIDANETLDGHIVFVEAGIYYEHVVVHKSLSLIGENRNTTIIDGSLTGYVIKLTANNIKITGFTIRKSGCGCASKSGVYVERYHQNVNVTNNLILQNGYGIKLDQAHNITITSNNITNNTYDGILLESSSNNSISKNNLINNNEGISFSRSSNNSVSDNIVAYNTIGIYLLSSSNNMIFHNNFVCNTIQVVNTNSNNIWNDVYASGGNYWSDYAGVDMKSGPNQDHLGSDAIGDTFYVIDGDNQDRYPLITTTIFRVRLSTRFGVVWEGETYHVDVISNSTVENFQFKQSGKLIIFNVTGSPETIGYCNVTIPKELLGGETWTVLVDGLPPTSEPTITPNTNHTSLYFTYELQSTKTVQIIGTEVIPEFPTWTSMLLILIVLTVAIIICKRARNPSRNSHNSHLR